MDDRKSAPARAVPVPAQSGDRLDSWKEIAAYLKRDIRTVQRWEESEGLPVHRHIHKERGSVHAYRAEIDVWRQNRLKPLAAREPVEADSTLGTTPESPRTRRPRLIAGVAIALAGLAAASVFVARRLVPGPGRGQARIEGLAVLPFQNLSGDPAQDYLGDGIADELIAELGKTYPQLVISRTSTLPYKYLPKPLPEVGRELHVGCVVEGTVIRSGKEARVTVQLIEAATDRHLWANSYEGNLSDLLAFEHEIARAIVGEVQQKLTPQPRSPSDRMPLDSEAYDDYLKGRYSANQRSEEGLLNSLAYFQQALQKDGDFAAAYAGMGESYALLTGYGDAPAKDFYAKARAFSTKALAKDEGLAEAHAVLGLVMLYYDWDWAGAEQELKRAIGLQPSLATAHHWLAYCLLFAGRQREALGEIQRAAELDPLSLIIKVDISEILYYQRRYEDSIRQIQAALDFDPNSPVAHARLGHAFVQTSNYERAIEQFQQAVKLPSGNPSDLAGLAFAYARSGRRDEARKILARLRTLSQTKHVRLDRFALVYLGLGEQQEAIRCLEKAYAETERPALIYLTVEPEFDSLRSNQRFQDFMRRIGLSS